MGGIFAIASGVSWLLAATGLSVAILGEIGPPVFNALAALFAIVVGIFAIQAALDCT